MCRNIIGLIYFDAIAHNLFEIKRRTDEIETAGIAPVGECENRIQTEHNVAADAVGLIHTTNRINISIRRQRLVAGLQRNSPVGSEIIVEVEREIWNRQLFEISPDKAKLRWILTPK